MEYLQGQQLKSVLYRLNPIFKAVEAATSRGGECWEMITKLLTMFLTLFVNKKCFVKCELVVVGYNSYYGYWPEHKLSLQKTGP
ncbi:hypothetical protein HUJ04_005213 [Dendroctonus ponderosae]|nr:hypothetical protein HUJ04_005213 [Dendroctonus ponderosae]